MAIHLSTIFAAITPRFAFSIRMVIVNVMRFASRWVAQELVQRPVHCRKETIGALPWLVFGAPAIVSIRSALGVVRITQPKANEAISTVVGSLGSDVKAYRCKFAAKKFNIEQALRKCRRERRGEDRAERERQRGKTD